NLFSQRPSWACEDLQRSPSSVVRPAGTTSSSPRVGAVMERSARTSPLLAPRTRTVTADQPKYPGLPDVINGNGAVAHVMKHVCGGVTGYPITPSTEISETFEAARAEGQLNVWGKHPFFVEAEGDHSAQSGALGAALTGGNFIS